MLDLKRLKFEICCFHWDLVISNCVNVDKWVSCTFNLTLKEVNLAFADQMPTGTKWTKL